MQRVAGMAHERLADGYYGDHPHWPHSSPVGSHRPAGVADPEYGTGGTGWDGWDGDVHTNLGLPVPSPVRFSSRLTMRQTVAWLTPSSAATSACVCRWHSRSTSL